jgi:penicillin-binding protein 1A
MAQGKGHSDGRREPVFDASPSVRVSGADRPSGAPPRRRRRRKRKRRGAKRPLIVRLGYWGLVACLWLGIGGIGVLAWTGAHLPPIQSLEIPKRPPAIKIVDDRGRMLVTRGNGGGETVALKSLPRYVPQAFIAIEDRRFYSHFGVDPYGIARALMANVLHLGVSQGGSTITQQLAKNLFLTQDRTIHRKLQELLLALWLERKFSKDQILALYLNRVYFGAGAYGIEQASQRYFGKPAKRLTLAEAALLAGLVRAPSRLAPTRNFTAAERRARIVLKAMTELHFISKKNERLALANPPQIVVQAGNNAINYVADWVMDALNDVVGHVDEDLVVKTTIDTRLQTQAENALDDVLKENGAKDKVSQGALVAMTPEGAVRALVGGRDYAKSQFNRAVAAKRQPGSAFKPFVYLTALEHGLTPSTVRDDGPIKIKNWRPENYGRKYYGPVTLTQGLALSLNTVSVRLTLEFGPQAVIRTAHRLGITSHLEPNASIALGTSEVSLLELTGAYAPFANGGFADTPHVITRVTTARGKLLYARTDRPPRRIVDARYVAMMNEMMHQTLQIGTARHATFTGWPAAGKTGTSQDFRDAWFVGYTARLVTGVWLGNDDGTPTKHVTGGGLPVQVWSRVMRAAHQDVPVAALPGTGDGGGFFSGLSNLFGGNARAPAETNGSAPVPPAPVGASSARGNAGLDGWLLNNLFGRR